MDRHRRRSTGSYRRAAVRRRRLALLVVLTVAAVAVTAALLLRDRGTMTGRAASPRAASGGATPIAQDSPGAGRLPPPVVVHPSRGQPLTLWIGGDSLGGELGWSLAPLARATHVIKPVTFYYESSGFCRPDFFDWNAKVRQVMSGLHPGAAVIMVGTNDGQSVYDHGSWYAYGTSRWEQVYRRRVADAMATMLAHGARRVYWVGMPPVGEPWRSKRMATLDTIFSAEATAHPGVEYIDTWSLFADSEGHYQPEWRTADGVHFTVAGQKRLAAAVMTAIRRDYLSAP